MKSVMTGIAVAVLAFAPITQAELVADWSADADFDGNDTWTDFVSSKVLNFAGGAVTRVTVNGQTWNSAFSFGGAGEAVKALHDGSLFNVADAANSMSIAVLFNADSVTNNVVLFSDGGTVTGYSMLIDGNSGMRAMLKSGVDGLDPAQIDISGGSLTAGSWHQAVISIDAANSEMVLYLDGVQVASETGVPFGDFTGGNHTAIAGDNGDQLGGGSFNNYGDEIEDGAVYNGNFLGDIARVQVYDNKLSSTDVANLYAETIPSGHVVDLYDSWAEGFGGADVIGSRVDDYDGDHVSNLGEYALNGNPTDSEDKGQSSFSQDGSTFTYIHAKVVNNPKIVYRLLDSSDLVLGPITINTYLTQTVGPVVDGYQMVTNEYSMAEEALFITLEVEYQ